jgi:hypothetical protein
VKIYKGEIFVVELKKKWEAINNKAGVVVVSSKLFGKQRISLDAINTFCDDRIGVRIKEQELYIPLWEVISYTIEENIITVKSNMKNFEILIKST